jgi:hypothetical protein
MKKVLVLAFVILMVGATGAFALGGDGLAIGGETALHMGGTGGLPVGGMLLLHLPGFPLMIGVGVSSAPAVGVTADYWFAYGPESGIIGWYVGIGGYMRIDLEPNSFAFGARLPLGLQLWPLNRRNLEFFLEVAPAVGVRFVPTGFDWHLQAALGIRYWFS